MGYSHEHAKVDFSSGDEGHGQAVINFFYHRSLQNHEHILIE